MNTSDTKTTLDQLSNVTVTKTVAVKAVLFNRKTATVDVPMGTTVREVAMLVDHPNPDTARAMDDENKSYGPTDQLPTNKPQLFLSFVPNVAGS